MRFYITFAVLVGLTSLVGCGPTINKINLPGEKITGVGYEFMPLNEEGWMIIEPNRKYITEISKQATSPNGTYAIQIFASEIPSFEKDESYYDYAISGFLDQEENYRFEYLDLEAEKYENLKSLCVKGYSKVLDKDPAHRVPHPGPMILESITFLCRHPTDKRLGYFINYSHRYHEKYSDPLFIEVGTQVFENIYFVENGSPK